MADAKQGPPPLPPRENSLTINRARPLNLISSASQESITPRDHRHNDPRSSSMHSLMPNPILPDSRRKLLLIFVHGFMGNETSFQSFPAHVHNLVTEMMRETHAVHTKIYPRYKSRRAVNFVAEDFSTWLEPHEGPHVDIILLGHSMGGILDAELVLLPPKDSGSAGLHRHDIIGTINFDTPFLGMHPGLVSSGISSLFRAAPEAPKSKAHQSPEGDNIPANLQNASASQTNTSSASGSELSVLPTLTTEAMGSSTPSSETYNAPFPNDVRPQARSKFANLIHFVNKHSENLSIATGQYFLSHIDFGGCMADFSGLKKRYEDVRRLDETHSTAARGSKRVRFVNYYTASTGIAKKSKAPVDRADDPALAVGGNYNKVAESRESIQMPDFTNPTLKPATAIKADLRSQESISVLSKTSQAEERIEPAGVLQSDMDDDGVDDANSIRSMQHIESIPIPDSEDDQDDSIGQNTQSYQARRIAVSSEDISKNPTQVSTAASDPREEDEYTAIPPPPLLPLIPPEPEAPPPYQKNGDKSADKMHDARMKTYRRAVADRKAIIKEHDNILQKHERKLRLSTQEAEKARLQAAERAAKQETQNARKAEQEAEREERRKHKQEKREAEKRRKEAEKMVKERRSLLSGEEKRLDDERLRVLKEEERMAAEERRLHGEADTISPITQLNDSAHDLNETQPGTASSPESKTSARTIPTTEETSTQKPEISSKPPKAPNSGKSKKDRKFCLLPSDVWNLGGRPDECWVRVYMEGVDEVGAHCGLFFEGPQYEDLVKDVAARVKAWVEESHGGL